MRAGRLVLGTKAVREAARRGAISGALMAGDVTDNARARIVPLLRGLGVPVARCGTVIELGRAVGRERLAVVGIADQVFVEQLMTDLRIEEDGSWGT